MNDYVFGDVPNDTSSEGTQEDLEDYLDGGPEAWIQGFTVWVSDDNPGVA